jgi:hypothetical protein
LAEEVAAGGVVGALLESLELTPTSARAELAVSDFGEPAT